VTVSLYFHQIW